MTKSKKEKRCGGAGNKTRTNDSFRMFLIVSWT